MKVRRAIPLLIAGMLIPAAWGVSQEPPQPQAQSTQPPAESTPNQTDKNPQGKRPFHHHGGFWREGDPNGTMGRGRGGPPPNGRHGFPPIFDQLAKMSPEERNKALESDPKFSRLPPDRQAQIRERLERYSAMTPEQRQLMRDRFDIVNSMSPRNRDRIREVFPRWRQLPADRQQAMREEFHALARMSAADREKRFADPEFLKSFAPREQQLLKDLAASLR